MRTYTPMVRLVVLISVSLYLYGCEDPSDDFQPRNPDLVVSAVLGTAESSARLILGCERQLALAYQEVIPIAELVSDNYVNTQTFFNQDVDGLTISYQDPDAADSQFDIQRLRTLANFGLDIMGPADPGYTPAQEAEFLYFRGIAQLLGGSYFNRLPIAADSIVGTRSQLYELAIADFTEALDVLERGAIEGGELSNSILLARSRAYYQNSDCAAATEDARNLLEASPEFIRYVQFDVVNGVESTIQDAIFDRGSFDDLQPLPRLDFLDPKYNNQIDPTDDVDIPYLKAEEAHFIITESLLSEGDLEGAKQQLLTLLGLVSARPLVTIDDSAEGRTNETNINRPDTSSIRVRSSTDADFMSDLILDRGTQVITVPQVSGTSIDSSEVGALSSIDDALYTLYLMRQEVFIAEGRRSIDLGLTFTISENELLLNENVTEADVEPTIPDFIQSRAGSIDAFTYDTEAGEVTITEDLNRVLVSNRESDFVVPCF